jgi:hypothetical protein
MRTRPLIFRLFTNQTPYSSVDIKHHQAERLKKIYLKTNNELKDAMQRRQGVRPAVIKMYGAEGNDQLIKNWERTIDYEIDLLLNRSKRLDNISARLFEGKPRLK